MYNVISFYLITIPLTTRIKSEFELLFSRQADIYELEDESLKDPTKISGLPQIQIQHFSANGFVEAPNPLFVFIINKVNSVHK
jgi:hypothetical protein